jgi:hypothetical protein
LIKRSVGKALIDEGRRLDYGFFLLLLCGPLPSAFDFFPLSALFPP